MVKVAICGASGYAGAELLRILAAHSKVTITSATSEKSAGKRIIELFPHLHRYEDLTFEHLNVEAIAPKADVFFMALPHAASQESVDNLVKKKKRVIDLSADFRLRDAKVYEDWYKVPHKFSNTLSQAVYGLPELHRKKIARARIVANPGCYPTGAVIGLYPAVRHSLVDLGSIVIDSKSGTSGAGRQSDTAFSFCEVNEGFKAYGVTGHRHTPEIEQELSLVARQDVRVTFTPHLVPLDRGILTTIYARMAREFDTDTVREVYRKAFANEPFVRILDQGKFPNVKNVRGTNFCEIGTAINKRTGTLIVVTAIDNLVKGAAGQAVQNMNIMMGYRENTALDAIALCP